MQDRTGRRHALSTGRGSQRPHDRRLLGSAQATHPPFCDSKHVCSFVLASFCNSTRKVRPLAKVQYALPESYLYAYTIYTVPCIPLLKCRLTCGYNSGR